jgi:hypothetical protein
MGFSKFIVFINFHMNDINMLELFVFLIIQLYKTRSIHKICDVPESNGSISDCLFCYVKYIEKMLTMDRQSKIVLFEFKKLVFNLANIKQEINLESDK